MSYHDYRGVQTTPSGTFNLRQYDSSGQSYPSVQVDAHESTLSQYPFFGDYRVGTNSSLADLVRVFGSTVPMVTYHKKKVGNELKYKWRIKRFRDSKGRWHSRQVKVTYFKSVYINVPRVVMPKDRTKLPKDQRFYLKPNKLIYAMNHNIMLPSTIGVRFKIDGFYGIPGLGFDGFASLTGIGSFFPKLFLAPRIDIPGARYNNAFHPGASDPQLDMEALNKLYKKAQSELPNYFVAVGESPELLKLIKRIALEGYKLFREIYKLDVKRLAGRLSSNVTAKDLAEIWLTWIYAISPTLSDVADTLDVISREARTWRSYSAASKRILVEDDTDNLKVFPLAKKSTTLISRYGLILEGKLSAEKYLLKAGKWQNIAGTAYELAPGSFMLDWFVDISSYLNSCTIFENLQYCAWKTVSKKLEYNFDGRFRWINPDDGVTMLQSDKFMTKSLSFAVERTLLNQLPSMPDIKVNKPVFDGSSLQRAINAVSILVANPQFLKPEVKDFIKKRPIKL